MADGREATDFKPESGLLIEVEPAEAAVSAWRMKYDADASDGIPAHITVLYPFVQPALIDDGVLARAAEIAAGFASFDFELTSIEQFPGVVWLRPDPEGAFRAMTKAFWDVFPQCPPYDNRYPDPQPHLTVGQIDDPVEQALMHTAIEAEIGSQLPIACRATAITLFVTNEPNTWTRPRRFELG